MRAVFFSHPIKGRPIKPPRASAKGRPIKPLKPPRASAKGLRGQRPLIFGAALKSGKKIEKRKKGRKKVR